MKTRNHRARSSRDAGWVVGALAYFLLAGLLMGHVLGFGKYLPTATASAEMSPPSLSDTP